MFLLLFEYMILLKERVHSEMKISSIMRFNLLIMPIVLIFFQPLALAGRKVYGKMMNKWNKKIKDMAVLMVLD